MHKDVAEMLWQLYRVLVIFLPTCACEGNQKELVWHTMVRRVNSRPLPAIPKEHGFGKRIISDTAAYELDKMTVDEVKEYYAKCYSFLKYWKALPNKHNKH